MIQEPVIDSGCYVTARNLSLGYGAVPILRAVDIDLVAGDEVALTGRSGSGKTSLLLVLAGLVAPDSGLLAWPGLVADPWLRRRQIGIVFQAPSLLPELTALENVALPLRLWGEPEHAALAAGNSALEQLGVLDAAAALPAELSGGQQQRVSIARVLAGRPRLILADEPTGALDRTRAHDALVALRGYARQTNASLVVATHDRELARLLRDEITIVDHSLLRSAVQRVER